MAILIFAMIRSIPLLIVSTIFYRERELGILHLLEVVLVFIRIYWALSDYS